MSTYQETNKSKIKKNKTNKLETTIPILEKKHLTINCDARTWDSGL